MWIRRPTLALKPGGNIIDIIGVLVALQKGLVNVRGLAIFEYIHGIYHYQQVSMHAACLLQNKWTLWQKAVLGCLWTISLMDSIRVDNWRTELAIIASNIFTNKFTITKFLLTNISHFHHRSMHFSIDDLFYCFPQIYFWTWIISLSVHTSILHIAWFDSACSTLSFTLVQRSLSPFTTPIGSDMSSLYSLTD